MVPKFCHGLVVSSLSASVFGILDKLMPKAQMDMWVLFDLTESQQEQVAQQL